MCGARATGETRKHFKGFAAEEKLLKNCSLAGINTLNRVIVDLVRTYGLILT